MDVYSQEHIKYFYKHKIIIMTAFILINFLIIINY